jgi:hypothetical protein
MSKRLGDVLPLQVFIRRAQVLRLYRNMLRLTRPEGEQKEQRQQLREHVRDRFRTYQHVQDHKLIATLIADGQRQMEQLKAIVDTAASGSGGDSWINTKDEKDPRGRVGEGWPWEQ